MAKSKVIIMQLEDEQLTDEKILELAKTFGFNDMIGERDDETDGGHLKYWHKGIGLSGSDAL